MSSDNASSRISGTDDETNKKLSVDNSSTVVSVENPNRAAAENDTENNNPNHLNIHAHIEETDDNHEADHHTNPLHLSHTPTSLELLQEGIETPSELSSSSMDHNPIPAASETLLNLLASLGIQDTDLHTNSNDDDDDSTHEYPNGGLGRTSESNDIDNIPDTSSSVLAEDELEEGEEGTTTGSNKSSSSFHDIFGSTGSSNTQLGLGKLSNINSLRNLSNNTNSNSSTKRILLTSPGHRVGLTSNSSLHGSIDTDNDQDTATALMNLDENNLDQQEKERLTLEIPTTSFWRSAPVVRAPLLNRLLLDIEYPQLNMAMIEYWQNNDAALHSLLDFITRPIDQNVHAGASNIGIEAVATLAIGKLASLTTALGPMKSSSSTEPSEFELAYAKYKKQENESDTGSNIKLSSTSPSLLSSSNEPSYPDWNAYGLVNFATKQSSVSSALTSRMRSSSTSIVPHTAQDGVTDSASQANNTSRTGRGNSFVFSITGGMSDTEGEDSFLSSSHNSLNLSILNQPHGHHPIGAQESAMMAQAVSSAHAAAFSAAVTDLCTLLPSANDTDSVNDTNVTPTKGRDNTVHSSNKQTPTSLSPSMVGSSHTFTGVSLLFPRSDQEVNSLTTLTNHVQTLTNNKDKLTIEQQEVLATVPTVADMNQAKETEVVSLKRSYRLMRMLCGATSAADDLLFNRAEDIAKAMFSVFSSRYKGSFHHACAVLQRLIQYQPEALARAVASDSQRYLGSMLNYLHHDPVADTVVQIVSLSHLASAYGGVGPAASMNGGGNAFGGGAFGGMMFSSMGRDRGGSLTSYDGPLNMYSSRGTSVSNQTRHNLYRSLTGWGFLSVLASHVYRPEYAVCPEHVVNAGEIFIHFLKAFSTDEKADTLLTPLGSDTFLLRGLISGAVAPKPGYDFPLLVNNVPSASNNGDTTSSSNQQHIAASFDAYCADGSVPVRQRLCMKVLSELTTLAFQDTVPIPPEPGSGQMGGGLLGAPVRTVENRVAKYATTIAAALVQNLPRLAAALVRIHRAVHPDIPTTPQKHRGPTNATLNQTPGNGGDGEKKKKKKKKKKNKGANSTATATVVRTESGEATTAGTTVESEEDDEGEDATTNTPASPNAAMVSPVNATLAASTSSATTAVSPPPVSVAPPPAPPVPFTTGNFIHPGYNYRAPFGTYRVAAFQVIAALVSRDNQIPKQDTWLPPPTTTDLLNAQQQNMPASVASSSANSVIQSRDGSVSRALSTPTFGGIHSNRSTNGMEESPAVSRGTSVEPDRGKSKNILPPEELDEEIMEDSDDESNKGGSNSSTTSSKKSNNKKGSKGTNKNNKHKAGSNQSTTSSKSSGSNRKSTGSTEGSRDRSSSNASNGSEHDDSNLHGSNHPHSLVHRKGGRNSTGRNRRFGTNDDHSHEPVEMIKTSQASLDALTTAAYLAIHPHVSSQHHNHQNSAGRSRSTSTFSTSNISRQNTDTIQSPSSPSASVTGEKSVPVIPSAAIHAVTNGLYGLPTGSSASSHPPHVSASGLPLLENHAGVPVTFDPLDFWGCMVTWVTLYAHTNLYHISFFSILKAVLKMNHEHALNNIFIGGRLVSTFVNHYKETTPKFPVPGETTTNSVTTSHAFTAPILSKKSSSLPLSMQLSRHSNGNSGSRGTILRSLNAVRLVSSSYPPTSFLCQHLQGHTLWSEFQPVLKEDTATTMKPLVPVASKGSTAQESIAGFSALQSLLSPSNYSALLGPNGLNFLTGKTKEKKTASLTPPEEEELEWNLGSSFAKELGFDGLTKYVDTSSATSTTNTTPTKEEKKTTGKTATTSVTTKATVSSTKTGTNHNTDDDTDKNNKNVPARPTSGKKNTGKGTNNNSNNATSVSGAPKSSSTEVFTTADLLGVD